MVPANAAGTTDWRIVAEEVASCNGAWGCPCQFWALPTHGSCKAQEATAIERGHLGETPRWKTTAGDHLTMEHEHTYAQFVRIDWSSDGTTR